VLGTLKTEPAATQPDLLAPPVVAGLAAWPGGADRVLVAPIDPDLADTAAFCQAYQVDLELSANCVVVAGRRGGEVRYAACLVLATTRADVNGVVRRHLDVRKASFAPMDEPWRSPGWSTGGSHRSGCRTAGRDRVLGRVPQPGAQGPTNDLAGVGVLGLGSSRECGPQLGIEPDGHDLSRP
jgi:hypothetical protein